jgi:DNA-binding MarR family transcriptional regulator
LAAAWRDIMGRKQLADRDAETGRPPDRAPDRAAGSARRRDPVDLGVLNDRAGYFVRRFQMWIFQDFIRTLESVDIRPAQYSVLALVEANPGRSQADIGHTLGIERARLVRLLDELERRGLIQRLPSTGDRRSHALFLAPAGRKTFERIARLAARHEARVADRIGDARRRQLIELLKDFDW